MTDVWNGRQRRQRLAFERLEPRLVFDASMLRITEFLASNDNGITDADGDSSDWIEIYNSGDELVDLSGIHLTDDDDELDRWAFPSGTTLEAGGYLIVFASNKNTILAGAELHTNFAISADGEYLAIIDTDGSTIIDEYVPDFPPQLEDISYGREMELTGVTSTLVSAGAGANALRPTSDALDSTWQQVDFVDATWPISGPTGIGYETSPGDPVNFTSQIETAVPTDTESIYIRVPFTLDSLAGIDQMTLRMKYDDGFVAYINGVQIAEDNAPETVAWDSIASAVHNDGAALQFVDFDASSAIQYLRGGENVLAIHGLNVSSSSDMLIVPELIAKSAVISEPEKLGHFETPTPGYGNGEAVAGFVAQPEFSVAHGFYDTTQSVAIVSSTPGAKIVYTTDGSTPEVDANLNVVNGTLYTGPVTVSTTTVLRARTFKLDFRPSFVAASSYIFVGDVVNQSPLGQAPAGWPASGVVNGQRMDYGVDPDIVNLYGAEAIKDSLQSISTISISTDLGNLFDPDTGIYVNATNRGRSWERPATIELINPDGSTGFDVNAGLRIRGGFSRGDFNPKHAFRFFFRGEYGDAKLNFPVFGEEGVDEFDVLDLRTSQNYAWTHTLNDPTQNSFVREVFGRDAQRDMESPYTRSRYHHLYVNGVYWGLFQTQERVEEHYGASYFGGNEADYDVVKAGGNLGRTEISSGNDLAWRELFDYGEALAADPAANANLYWTMQGRNPDGTRNPQLPVLVDVDNLIDYMLVIFYTGGYDSGITRFGGDNRANNWFGIYNRVAADQGFQFFIHDNEHSMGAGTPPHNTQDIDRTGPFNNGNQSNYAQFNPAYLHQDLLASQEYVQRFRDRVQLHFFNDGALTVAKSVARLNSRRAEVDPAIVAESARWGDSAVATPFTKADWQNEIDWLLDTYLPTRGTTVLGQLADDGLQAPLAPPVFSQYGGVVPQNYPLTISSRNGAIYYTTDGETDPRAIGGELDQSAAVKAYTGPISLSENTTVIARLRTAGGVWSALIEVTFTTVALPGDYDGNGIVEPADYLTWKANFGATVAPGVGADGSGNGVVDAADYTVWRDNLGASLSLVAADGTVSGDSLTALPATTSEPIAAESEAAGGRTTSLVFDQLYQMNLGVDHWSETRRQSELQRFSDFTPVDPVSNTLLLMAHDFARLNTLPAPSSASSAWQVNEAAFCELDFASIADELLSQLTDDLRESF